MANARRRKCLRPGTKKNLFLHIKSFLYFCAHYHISDTLLTPEIICAYIEFLINSFPSPATVKNYVSSLATLQAWRGLNLTPFKSFPVLQMWKAVRLTVRYSPKERYVLSMAEFKILLKSAAILGENALVFRALLVLLYFGMLRISSLIPSTPALFDHTRHLTSRDVQFVAFGMLVTIRWAKNRQDASQFYRFPVLKNNSDSCCPVKFLQEYIASVPVISPLQAFLQFRAAHAVLPLGARQAYSWLRHVLKNSPLAGRSINFYSVRRSACTNAYQAGASLNDVKTFGGWHSDAVLRYLHEKPAFFRVAGLLAKNC